MADKYELYNLTDDPMESMDLAKDVQHTQRLDHMKQELHTWMRSVVRSINGQDYKGICSANG
jgi:hypothetical protein